MSSADAISIIFMVLIAVSGLSVVGLILWGFFQMSRNTEKRNQNQEPQP